MTCHHAYRHVRRVHRAIRRHWLAATTVAAGGCVGTGLALRHLAGPVEPFIRSAAAPIAVPGPSSLWVLLPAVIVTLILVHLQYRR